MSFAETFLPQFEREMAGTRKTLERVPEDKFDWRPHPKSSALGQLASHLATLPTLAANVIEKDSREVAPEGKPPVPPKMSSRQEMLEAFDQNVAAARTAISGASDGHLAKTWTLFFRGQTIFSAPRVDVLRNALLSHMIHHRAQLGVYLRMNDIPVPSLYGPTADEQLVPPAAAKKA